MMANRLIGVVHSAIKSHKGIFTTPNSSKNPLGLGLYKSFFAASLHSINGDHNHLVGSNSFEIVTNLDEALNMFDKMTQTRPLPSIVNFTKLLDFVTNMNNFSCSIHLFKQMCAVGVPFDNYTASILIKCYCSLFDTTVEGFTVLGSCFKRGIVLDVSTYNTILNGFILEDRTHEVETLFKKILKDQLCEPDVVTYNTMIKGLCKIGNNYTAIALLRLMDGRGCTPNDVSFNTIIHALCNDLLINDAFKLFKEMVSHKNIRPNVDTYNSLIYAFCNYGRWDDLPTMLKQMVDENISPNVKTFNILVDALCKQGKVKDAQAVCDLMVERGNYHPDIVTYNSLINGYCLQDEISKANTVFDDMVFRAVEPNADTYNRFKDWHSRHLTIEEYYNMCQARGVKTKHNRITEYIISDILVRVVQQMHPDIDKMQPQVNRSIECLYKEYLRSFCDDYRVESALHLFHFMDDRKLNSNIDVYNILIDGASKCGMFDTARSLFHDLVVKGFKPDVKTYRVMIKGFCVRGLLRDTKQLFLKMEKSDCRPNSDIINDLIQGYVENKSFDDAVVLSRELETRGFKKCYTSSIFFWED